MNRKASAVINYDDIHLSESVSDILMHDIWVSDEFSIGMLNAIINPVKFTASAAIFVKRGKGRVNINLIEYEVTAPAIVIIRQGQIMSPVEVSPDFDASFVVLSRKLTDTLFRYINTSEIYSVINRHPVVAVDPNLAIHFNALHIHLRNIVNAPRHPYAYECVVHTILSFFFRYGYLPFQILQGETPSAQGRIADRFLRLVQENFRTERFLDFYASELGITPKHLSRTIKAQTGVSAVSWIERHVILEAQVMLKSSNLNIQQISDELNFKSQSFFGKYFKKTTGMSPKEFRKSR